MSYRDRHEGISCDSCGKSNFRGRRYKCLLCYDYDLCSACYHFGAVSGRHTTDHAMQCLITRADYDSYFGGEAIPVDIPQSYTCPLCNTCGFTQALLEEHVTSEHVGCGSGEIICPICASTPSTDAEILSEDFAAHLLQHSRSSRSDLDESTGSRHMRRIFNRVPASVRSRRMNMQSNSNTSQLRDNLPTNLRDSNIDPIAELLSQLSGSRTRSQQQSVVSVPSHLQQLHLQMQIQGQQQSRQNSSEWTYKKSSSVTPATTTPVSSSNTTTITHQVSNSSNTVNNESTPLLSERATNSKLTDEEQHSLERERANRGLFVQQLFLSSLTEKFDDELKLLYNRDNDDYNTPS